MSLKGLPDFQQPIQSAGFLIFYPFEGGREHIVVPDRLEIAERKDGRPDFLLEFVRGQNPFLPPAPHGVLDFRVRPHYRMEEALTFLRNRHPEAVLAPARFEGGFLRLRPAGDMDNVPDDLREPVPLAWNGLGIARYSSQISPSTATLLERSLRGELLLLYASAELEIKGVSPRLSIDVRFDPAELLEALVPLANEERHVAWEDIFEFFRQDLSTLPLEVSGERGGPELNQFAAAMTDRVRKRFGTFIPAPKVGAGPHLALDSPEEVGSGTFQWDLSEPFLALRPFVLSLHPLEAARQLVQDHGLGTVVRRTVVPSLATGVLPVSVSANLPPDRPGILSLGVTIRVPPWPPHRFQAVVESVELEPPEDAATIRLRLSPAEKPEYLFSTFVVTRDSGGIEQLEGEEIHHQGGRLDLTPDDFPVDFVPVEASRGLLEEAVVRGSLQWPDGESEVERSFELDLDEPAIALALPKGTDGATLEIEARAHEGSRTLHLGPIPAEGLHLGRHSFPEYGPHTIEIECVFDDNTQLLAIDLLPEDRVETPEEINVLHFTPARPKREWTWFAQSPFHPGYRYRPHSGPDEEAGEWSEVRSPFGPLKIHAAAS